MLSEETQGNTEDSTAFDSKTIIENAFKPVESDIPTGVMKKPEIVNEESKQESTQSQAEKSFLELNPESEYRIKRKGEDIGLSGKKFQDYAQKGFDYEQKMREFNLKNEDYNSQLSDFEAKREAFEKEFKEIKGYDEFLKKHPNILQRLQQEYYQAGGQDQFYGNPDQLIAYPTAQDPRISELTQTVQLLKDELDSRKSQEAQSIEEQRNAKLDEEMASVKDKYSYLNWDEKDEYGNDLQDQILQFGIDRQIKSYEDAAMLYKFQDIVKREKVNASEGAAKKVQQQHKLGLGPITKEPMRQFMTNDEASQDKSYDGALSRIKAKYGIKL